MWAASREGLSDPRGRLLLPEAGVEAIGQFAKSPALPLDSDVAVVLGGLWPGARINQAGALAGPGQVPSWLLAVRPAQGRHGAQHIPSGTPGRLSLRQSSPIRASASAASGGSAPL